MLGKLVVVVGMMFGFGYALVPLYRSVCEALGINVLTLSQERSAGDTGVSEAPVNTQVDASRIVTVEFDANARGPWAFKPEQRSVQVHPGEITTVMFDFKNLQRHAIVAQAIPSYAPIEAGAHFNKLQCFCFTQHTLAAGESARWPVVFVVDAKLPRDVQTITLSYTFFEVDGAVPAAGAALGSGA
jgi:cytochrome c oxidase assembly protein subunit 11